ncbi:MAG: hypothetical protein KIS72_08225 [Luteimonas sp.]|nr:hypothetical protein [Luteimonas sp.]
MDRSGIRDDVAPWSFFLPVTLAVVVGALLAGLILRAVDRVFAPESPGRVSAEAVPRPAPAVSGAAPVEPASTASRTSVPPADSTGSAARESQPVQGAAQAEAPSSAGVPVLPGAIVARRDGAAEACISGSIARRADNGWEQRLENDAPVPCVEQSAATR